MVTPAKFILPFALVISAPVAWAQGPRPIPRIERTGNQTISW
jgi:hypothetical protein